MSVTCSIVRSPVRASAKCADKPRTARRVGRALSFKQNKKGLKATGKTKRRKSRVLFHYTKEELEPYFHISQKAAAKQLGIAVITLKRICKRGKFNWPYRANKTKELQDSRNIPTVEAPARRSPGKVKAVRKGKTASRRARTAEPKPEDAKPRPQRASYPAFVGETHATQEAMRQALQSLALCAVKIEKDEIEQARMTAAAITFSRLPLLCMLENEDTIVL
jgi:hypothetical protein